MFKNLPKINFIINRKWPTFWWKLWRNFLISILGIWRMDWNCQKKKASLPLAPSLRHPNSSQFYHMLFSSTHVRSWSFWSFHISYILPTYHVNYSDYIDHSHHLMSCLIHIWQQLKSSPRPFDALFYWNHSNHLVHCIIKIIVSLSKFGIFRTYLSFISFESLYHSII